MHNSRINHLSHPVRCSVIVLDVSSLHVAGWPAKHHVDPIAAVVVICLART